MMIVAASQSAAAHWQPTRRQALVSGAAGAASLAYRPVAAVAAASQSPTPPPASVPTYPLADGLNISRVIKGCWQLSGGHHGDRATDRTAGKAAVEDFQKFVDVGVTTFDTADIYGNSQQLIGEYLKTHPDAKSQCQVLTKFCCFGAATRDATKAAFVERSIDESRIALQMNALDCVQFYWHDYSVKNYVTASLHLADLQASGKIRAIGVTNFDTPRLAEMIDAGVPIVANQIQYSLLDTRPENGMAQYCLDKKITLLPYGSVAGGFLSDKYLGKKPSDVSVNTYSLSKYASVINQRGGWDWFQQLLLTLRDVADKHDVSIADVSSRWVLQRPGVGGVIIGARNAEHADRNAKLFGFELNREDDAKIQAVLDAGKKPKSDCYSWERGGQW